MVCCLSWILKNSLHSYFKYFFCPVSLSFFFSYSNYPSIILFVSCPQFRSGVSLFILCLFRLCFSSCFIVSFVIFIEIWTLCVRIKTEANVHLRWGFVLTWLGVGLCLIFAVSAGTEDFKFLWCPCFCLVCWLRDSLLRESLNLTTLNCEPRSLCGSPVDVVGAGVIL